MDSSLLVIVAVVALVVGIGAYQWLGRSSLGRKISGTSTDRERIKRPIDRR